MLTCPPRLLHQNLRLVSKETIYRVQQKQGLLECGWYGNNMGVIVYYFNLNVSPKMSYCVLECDTVML